MGKHKGVIGCNIVRFRLGGNIGGGVGSATYQGKLKEPRAAHQTAGKQNTSR